jgi:hypothetical protein
LKDRLSLQRIEINPVRQGNLTCAGCSHASPISARWNADPVKVKRDLTGLHTAADAEEVSVGGG